MWSVLNASPPRAALSQKSVSSSLEASDSPGDGKATYSFIDGVRLRTTRKNSSESHQLKAHLGEMDTLGENVKDQ